MIHTCEFNVCLHTPVADATACGPGQECCGGSCYVACPDGTSRTLPTCVCVCGSDAECDAVAAGSICCPTGCADPDSDRFNCGACGRICPECQACAAGSCATDTSQDGRECLTPGGLPGACTAGACCRGSGLDCTTDGDCCGDACTGGVCCKPAGAGCTGTADCCSGLCSGAGFCLCGLEGTACASGVDCYSGVCTNGLCECSPASGACNLDFHCCSGACSGGVCG
jgi:hypothetical protein